MPFPSPRPRAGRRAVRLAFVAALAFAAARPGAARADVSAEQRAAAQVLFDDARKLSGEKRWAEACPKFEESQRVDPGLGTLLYLAECQAQMGKTASAWANFLEAAYQAKNSGQAKREATARSKAVALEPRLSKLTINAPAGVEVRRDGIVVAPSAWGTAFPVDPGEHLITATALGMKTWETKIVVKDSGDRVTIGVPALDPDAPAPSSVKPPAPPPPPPPIVPSAPASKPPPPPPPNPVEPPDAGAGARRVVGILFLVVGAGGVGAGAAFAAMAKSKYDDSLGFCLKDHPNQCFQGGVDLRQTARRNGDIATVGLIAGGVAGTGGLVLLLSGLAGKSAPRVGGISLTAAVDPRGSTALGVSGRF